MKKNIKYILISLALIVGIPIVAFGAPDTTYLSNRVIIATTTAGCAQINGTGLLSSTGVNCGSGSGGVGTSTNPFMATYFVATSTTATSTFPNTYISQILQMGLNRLTDDKPFYIKNWTLANGDHDESFSTGFNNVLSTFPRQVVYGTDITSITDVGGGFGYAITLRDEDAWGFGNNISLRGSRVLGTGVNIQLSGVGSNAGFYGHDITANGDGNQYGLGRNLTFSASDLTLIGQNLTGSTVGNTEIGNSNTTKTIIDSSGNLIASGYIKGTSGIVNESTYQDSLGSTGGNGNVLLSTGSATVWTATSSLGISGGASLSGGSTNALTYWTSATTVGATTSPTVGYITATTTTPSVLTGGFTTTGNSSIGVADTARPLTVSSGNGIFSHFGSNIANTNGNCTGLTFGLITAGSYIKSGIAQVQRADGNNRGDVVILNNNTGNSSNVGCTDIVASFKPDGKVGIGTTTPAGFLGVAGSGYFNGSLTGTSIVKTGGTSAQFLKADGSVDSSTYLTSAVTSVTGTYPVVSSGGTTPAISLAFGTTTSNTWASTQTFGNTITTNASTTNFTASGLSSTTNLVVSTNSTLNGTITLPITTSATVGLITKAGTRFLHDYGTESTALGNTAGNLSMTGIANSFFGSNSGRIISSGQFNSCIGRYSCFSLTTGSGNNAQGNAALYDISTQSNNTGVGNSALAGSTGAGNTAIGSSAGQNIGAVTNNTYIGYNAGFGGTASLSNATCIGYNCRVSGSNSLVLGGTGTEEVNVGIGTTTPTTALHVTDSSANATTTVTVGKVGQNKGSCLELFDSAGTAVYAYVIAGGTTFTLSTVSCK